MRDWRHENRLQGIHNRPKRALCPDCGHPTRRERGDEYAPTVRVCGACDWNDYDVRLREVVARAGEGALYGDAHEADI